MKVIVACMVFLCALGLKAQQHYTTEEKEQIAQSATTFINPYFETNNTTALGKQVEVWKQTVEKNSTNANNWMNYYMATRLWYLQSNGNQLSNKAKELLRQIAEKMDKEAEGDLNSTFGKQLVRYFETKEYNYNQATQYLLTAYKLSPTNNFLYAELALYYEITDNTQQRNAFCNNIPQVAYNTGLYTYSTLLLESLPDEAILFTNGEYDTYALWRALAAAPHKNIIVISNSLLRTKAYRDAVLKKYAIKTPVYNAAKHDKYIAQLAAFNTDKTIYLSLTLPKQYLNTITNQLYLLGYVYQYNKTNINNINTLYHNLVGKATPVGIGGDNQVYKNLLQGYIVLYRHYKTIDAPIAKQVYDRAKELSKKAGFWEDKYEAYFK